MNRIAVAGIALLVLGLGGSKVADALVEVPSLTELIEGSAAICFVEVREIRPWRTRGWWTQERIRVEVLRALRWSGESAEETVVVTRRSSVGMEDPPAQFPPVGGRALVFLQKNDEGDWVPTDPRYGLWRWSPESNSFSGMHPSLDYVDGVVACLRDPATSTECIDRLHSGDSMLGRLPGTGLVTSHVLGGGDAPAADAGTESDSAEEPGPAVEDAGPAPPLPRGPRRSP